MLDLIGDELIPNVPTGFMSGDPIAVDIMVRRNPSALIIIAVMMVTMMPIIISISKDWSHREKAEPADQSKCPAG